jgi:hypothetical protein
LRLGYLLVGLVGLMFPSVLCVWLVMVSVFAGGSRGGEAAADTAIPWGVVVVALLLFIPLHELLHAIWHPQLGLSPQSVMVIWPRKLRSVLSSPCLGIVYVSSSSNIRF